MQRPRVHLVAAFLLVLGLVCPRAAEAKRHHAHRHSHPSSFEVITGVNESAKSVTIGHAHGDDHSVKSVKVNEFTEITVNGQKGSLHDLHAGMMVDVDLDTDDVAAGLDATNVHK